MLCSGEECEVAAKYAQGKGPIQIMHDPANAIQGKFPKLIGYNGITSSYLSHLGLGHIVYGGLDSIAKKGYCIFINITSVQFQ